jgi:hypothetical protein
MRCAFPLHPLVKRAKIGVLFYRIFSQRPQQKASEEREKDHFYYTGSSNAWRKAAKGLDPTAGRRVVR